MPKIARVLRRGRPAKIWMCREVLRRTLEEHCLLAQRLWVPSCHRSNGRQRYESSRSCDWAVSSRNTVGYCVYPDAALLEKVVLTCDAPAARSLDGDFVGVHRGNTECDIYALNPALCNPNHRFEEGYAYLSASRRAVN
jgi:hypothetical protein